MQARLQALLVKPGDLASNRTAEALRSAGFSSTMRPKQEGISSTIAGLPRSRGEGKTFHHVRYVRYEIEVVEGGGILSTIGTTRLHS